MPGAGGDDLRVVLGALIGTCSAVCCWALMPRRNSAERGSRSAEVLNHGGTEDTEPDNEQGAVAPVADRGFGVRAMGRLWACLAIARGK